MAKYKESDESAGIFVPVYLGRQILPGTFEWTLSKLINKADLSAFDANYKNDEMGAAAYPPKVMLKVVLFSYSRGILSSRLISDACKYNIICKALAEDMEPEKSVIADFVSGNKEAITQVFVIVLLQCAELGLITGDLFAIDGCKLPSNASKEWSGTLKDLKKKKAGWEKLLAKLMTQQAEADKSEDKAALNDTCKGYIEDKELDDRHIERVQKKLKKLNEFLDKHPKDKTGADGTPIKNNITDEESANIKSSHGYIQGYNGIAIADSQSQVIVAAEAFGTGPEAQVFPEMLDKLNENMKLITGKEEPLKNALVEGDTGYFSEENLQEAAKRGIEVLTPDQQFRKRDEQFAEQKNHDYSEYYSIEDFKPNEEDNSLECPAGKKLKFKAGTKLRGKPMLKWEASVTDCRACPFVEKCIKKQKKGNKRGSRKTILIPDRDGKENLSEKMLEKIDKTVYRILYGQRMRIIEPCFSDMTYCKGMDRFLYRGKDKNNSQWLLMCIVHNIGKCIVPLGVKYAF
jgi:transposase